MQYPKEVTDPKKQLGEKLAKLNKLVTTEDRNAYREQYPISQPNLSIYLTGTVYDLEKAMKMIEFFQERINARNEKIKQLIN